MASAALLAEPDDLLLFAPSDHHIPDAALFARTVRTGVEAALAGKIVTFGVVPSFSEHRLRLHRSRRTLGRRAQPGRGALCRKADDSGG